jgi:thiol-disulfide isomerase/thioredoxin
MHSHLRALALAALLAHTPLALAAPPSDEQVRKAAAAFQELDRAGATNPATRPTDVIAWADKALEGIDVASLTLPQIETLINAKVFPFATSSRVVDDRLATMARESTVDGADAAALRLNLIQLERDPSAQQLLIRKTLRHPSLGEALKAGRASSVFMPLIAARPETLPDILALKDVIPAEMPAASVVKAVPLIDVVVGLAGDDNAEVRQPLRQRLLEAVRAARATNPTDADLAAQLAKADAKLDGAFMKGELLDHEAPPLTFTWSTFATPTPDLAALKGKVVILFFWTTWCEPCVVAFNDLRQLAAYYRGGPVAVVGITSLQGRHQSPTSLEDCAGDAEKEQRLMGEYVKTLRLPWDVAFTSQEVFNTQYGVSSIPHIVIIDTKGVVRYRKIHPDNRAVPLDEKIEKVDGLLKEAGINPPNRKK